MCIILYMTKHILGIARKKARRAMNTLKLSSWALNTDELKQSDTVKIYVLANPISDAHFNYFFLLLYRGSEINNVQ